MAPKPPGAFTPPPAPPSTLNPPTAPLVGAVPPSTIPRPPGIVTPAIAPAALASESKKETAKVPASTPGSKTVPQATVQLQKKPAASASKSVAPGAAITVAPQAGASEGEVSPLVGGLALAASLVAMGIQLWTMLG